MSNFKLMKIRHWRWCHCRYSQYIYPWLPPPTWPVPVHLIFLPLSRTKFRAHPQMKESSKWPRKWQEREAENFITFPLWQAVWPLRKWSRSSPSNIFLSTTLVYSMEWKAEPRFFAYEVCMTIDSTRHDPRFMIMKKEAHGGDSALRLHLHRWHGTVILRWRYFASVGSTWSPVTWQVDIITTPPRQFNQKTAL